METRGENKFVLGVFEQLINEVKVKFHPEMELGEHRAEQRAGRRARVVAECQ